MSQSRKRKGPESRQGSDLPESDQIVLDIIRSEGENAISNRNIQKETKLPSRTVTKCIKNLISLSLINEIPHAHLKEKHYIATEIKPSNTVTGGVWYLDGKLDSTFINELKNICLRIVTDLKVTTADKVYEFLKKGKVLTDTECTSQQISEILGSMVLENMIIEVKSTGFGDYHSIPVGNVCYRCLVGNLDQGPIQGAMVSVPCGVCPRIRECTPDGLISPSTCVYYTKWLEF